MTVVFPQPCKQETNLLYYNIPDAIYTSCYYVRHTLYMHKSSLQHEHWIENKIIVVNIPIVYRISHSPLLQPDKGHLSCGSSTMKQEYSGALQQEHIFVAHCFVVEYFQDNHELETWPEHY